MLPVIAAGAWVISLVIGFFAREKLEQRTEEIRKETERACPYSDAEIDRIFLGED